MYGQPMNPARCEFELQEDTFGDMGDPGDIILIVGDLDDPDNDDIRDVLHPDFDNYWGNACENVFVSDGVMHFSGIEDARQWCLSIGMKAAAPGSLEMGG